MKQVLFAVIMGIFPLTSGAGAIARQYASGFDGVSWGDSLADIVSKHPGGDHYFAFGGGQREYQLTDEQALFGISRGHQRIYYFFDDTGSVVSVGITFPYEQRTKLLGALTLSFGPPSRTFTRGISTFYAWPSDDGTGISVRATLDPSYGILEFSVFGPNSILVRKAEANCEAKAESQPQKK